MCEQCTGWDTEGNGRGLFEDIIAAFTWSLIQDRHTLRRVSNPRPAEPEAAAPSTLPRR
jgi:hypothetical protein